MPLHVEAAAFYQKKVDIRVQYSGSAWAVLTFPLFWCFARRSPLIGPSCCWSDSRVSNQTQLAAWQPGPVRGQAWQRVTKGLM